MYYNNSGKDFLTLREVAPNSLETGQRSSLTSPGLSQQIMENSSSLKHVWEIVKFLQCPVIGGSLSVEEHRKVLNKAGYPTKRKSPYQLHQAIMSHLGEKNRISLKVDNYLRYKYRNDIPAFKDLDEDTFMEKWKGSLETGNVTVMVYVAAIRRDMTETALDDIFGDIHMINHANLHEVNKSRQHLSLQVDANRKISRLLQQEKRKSSSIKKEMSSLKTSLKETRILSEKLKKTIKSSDVRDNEIAELQIQNKILRKKVRHAENQIEQLSEQKRLIESQKRQLEIKVYDLKAKNEILNNELEQFISKFSSHVECLEHCDKECDKLRLCAKRILIVGGIIKMKHLYRNLVESSGGQFEYHDGYMQNGKKNLENRIKRCDLVLCPVNCNSHGACNSVKKLCKRYSKPVKMLTSSSLSAISNAMFYGFGDKN